MLRLIGILSALVGAGAMAAAPQAAGQWIVTTDRFGNPEYSTLNLAAAGQSLSGDWDGSGVSGSIRGNALAFTAKEPRGGTYRFDGRLEGTLLRGTADYPDHNHADRRLQYTFTARRVPDRPAGGARTWDFAPTTFANSFSADRPPVLTVWPGDTVRTTTIDSGGIDAGGVTRALFGNPQTGPFFIAGAQQGDTLAVHIIKLTPNRDWAESLDSIVGRAVGAALSEQN